MPNNCPKLQTGFTLVELLITITIVAILARVAYPAYNDAILKARRAEAKSALHSAMLQQERFYTQHNTYSAYSYKTENSPFKRWSGDSAATSYYEISAVPCAGRQLNQCVLVTATVNRSNIKGFIDPVCGNLMLDSTNNKSYSNGTEPNPQCW